MDTHVVIASCRLPLSGRHLTVERIADALAQTPPEPQRLAAALREDWAWAHVTLQLTCEPGVNARTVLQSRHGIAPVHLESAAARLLKPLGLDPGIKGRPGHRPSARVLYHDVRADPDMPSGVVDLALTVAFTDGPRVPALPGAPRPAAPTAVAA